ncbi:hypothetical protein GNI_096130 [Gregarina niphandrodes]|uniref:Uncharacterized protein n=1 Tax=Gregarina niphandrodes TaxID=110365 RepID=A0A023B513_GRENI|nr:hypothetical protein GNI_096130 [Gregarina niphandrodes]EZG57972.1 hypothetical protein GNI_096130 [Gregarina niphandrodes]|eukprot:XP_011131001.1 hypothetical protein GNI_096130 [Gregarina niphandrodes]
MYLDCADRNDVNASVLRIKDAQVLKNLDPKSEALYYDLKTAAGENQFSRRLGLAVALQVVRALQACPRQHGLPTLQELSDIGIPTRQGKFDFQAPEVAVALFPQATTTDEEACVAAAGRVLRQFACAACIVPPQAFGTRPPASICCEPVQPAILDDRQLLKVLSGVGCKDLSSWEDRLLRFYEQLTDTQHTDQAWALGFRN